MRATSAPRKLPIAEGFEFFRIWSWQKTGDERPRWRGAERAGETASASPVHPTSGRADIYEG